MSRLLLILIGFLAESSFAGTDYQCVSDCQARNYAYDLCVQRCTYGGGAQPGSNATNAILGGQRLPSAPQINYNSVQTPLPPPLAYTPINIDVQAVQEQEQYKQQQLELQRLEIQRRQLEFQKQQNAQIQQDATIYPTSGWEYVTENKYNGNILYVNPSNIIKSGNAGKVWFLVDYKKTALTSTDGKAYYSAIGQYEYDCSNKKVRQINGSIRTEHMGVGQLAPTSFDNNWEQVTSDTRGGKLWKFACENDLQQNQASSQTKSEDNVQFQAAISKWQEKSKNLCADNRFAELFTKSPCQASDITFTQLTDESKIKKNQKVLLTNFRTEMDAITNEMNTARRTIGGDGNKRLADYLDQIHVEVDKYNLDLFKGLISWGEYNKLRKELNAKIQAEVAKIRQASK